LPVAAWGQSATPVVGYIATESRESEALRLPFFHEGLTESGYVEGQNLDMEYRWANHQYDRLPELAADLVRRRVAVIATSGGSASALAAKAATTTIPSAPPARDMIVVRRSRNARRDGAHRRQQKLHCVRSSSSCASAPMGRAPLPRCRRRCMPAARETCRLVAFVCQAEFEQQATDQECAAPRPEPARMRPCHQCHRLHAHAPWLA
jgi:hypothetical protein